MSVRSIALLCVLGLVACDDSEPFHVCFPDGGGDGDGDVGFDISGPVSVDLGNADDVPEFAPIFDDPAVDDPLDDVVGDSVIDDAIDSDIPEPDAPRGCATCHGSGENPAPPLDTEGNADTSLRTVGAHRTHGRSSFIFRTVLCSDCHLVPGRIDEPQHIDAAPAELTFSALASADGVDPVFDGETCTVYCHGVSLSGGGVTEPTWTLLDGSQNYCGACHGTPPTENHPEVSVESCGSCHPFFGGPVNHELHVNGVVEVAACGDCHGIPPTSGAHLVHFSDPTDPPEIGYGDPQATAELRPDGVDGYMFGCGNCHPTDGTYHFNGVVDVNLYDANLYVAPPYDTENPAPATLKGRNPQTAAFADGTCSDVYCHSSGQEVPEFVFSLNWEGSSTTPEARCAQCHGNPPNYRSGGAGTSTANSHLVPSDLNLGWGYSWGHFWSVEFGEHKWPNTTAPMTCQTCHYNTVDPANTGDTGYYYLDTSGDYTLGEGYCDGADCHSGAEDDPPTGTGRVLTGNHVNGVRDVSFDPRNSIPAEVAPSWFPADRPLYPYWTLVGGGVSSMPPPEDANLNGSTWSASLTNATYDPDTKTCYTVACHSQQTYDTFDIDDAVWGETSSSCSCHGAF